MKTWQQRERARDVLAREVGYVRKPHGGRLRVALAFPNTYYVGMSSLGYQTVYRLFNERDDVVCERVFLPGRQELAAQLASGVPLRTMESNTPVRDFDVFAFSIVASVTTRPLSAVSIVDTPARVGHASLYAPHPAAAWAWSPGST